MKMDMFKTKAFRAGGYSVFAAILVIAISIAVIFVTDSLPSKFTKLDTTKSNLFGLAEETKTLVSGLDEDVNIYVITRQGAEDTLLTNVLANYEGLSGKLHVEIKDPVINPTFTDKYTQEEINLNSLVIESGSKSKYISYEELFDQSFAEDYTTKTSFIGESEINSAIRAVTEDSETTLFAVTGHGETVLSEDVTKTIENNNITLENVNLLAQGTDLDAASCVLIYEPKQDFSAAELDVLSSYISGGGNVLLYTEMRGMNLPDFNSFMQGFGVSADATVVLEYDERRILNGQPYYMFPEFSEHDITKPLSGGNYYVMTAFSHPIDILEGADAKPILTTTENGYRVPVKADGTLDADGASGPEKINLGVSVNSGEGQIVWYSATSMLESQVGANSDLFLNSINWMCERENAVTIHAKSLDPEYLTVNTLASRILSVLLIFIIPAAFIGLGVYVWVKRRRK